jgi:type I restriction-modification system DNA methylase subunit
VSIYQKSILKNTKQNETLIATRWANYQEYISKIDFIRDIKEEKYQDGFLSDIFEECLGYTLDTTNPNSYNLAREEKNETDSKKADGVIIIENKVVGVIELKDQKTKNLDKIETQAFNYHNSHSNSHYIIISNFDELRFYIDKKTNYEKFNLFTLNYEEFKKLHLLLSYDSIKDELPLKLKDKSSNYESQISKELYKDFNLFRTHLFDNIVKNNNLDKSLLLKLTQKLCDRIIFILFAEDRGLLSPNTIREIREEFKNQKFTDYKLYDIYKFYFDGINKGNDKLNIAHYNGGLFAKDDTLDNLIIDDDILDMEAQKLSDYDFESEVSINILGHIFEQSLTDLEELQASIQNQDFDKKKTKRKKDGVFYTPEYITKYIVQNTIGKLCDDKREELQIQDIQPPKNSKKPTKKEQVIKQNLEEYKKWLLNIKILDPACGSGAFLNQALEYLIAEHTRLQSDFATMGDITAYYTIETSILENNLYGVDINEEACEIARLSLWIRTAQKGRVLTNLSDKIKCANSLLDMPFDENSFDCVIGNPPYVRVQGLKSNYEKDSKLYEKLYMSAVGNYDLYVLFIEKSYKMLNSKGKLSYILPHKFLISDFGVGIREFLSSHMAVERVLHFGSEMVFEDASTYTCILTLSQNNKKIYFKHIKPKDIFQPFEYDSISYKNISSDKWNLSNNDTIKVLTKLNKQQLKVKDVFAKIFQGLATSGDDVYLLQNTKKGLYSKSLDRVVDIEDSLLKPILKGEDVSRYKNLQNKYYVIFPYIIESGKAIAMSEEYIKDNFPNGYEYLKANEEFLRGREKGKMDKNGWFLYIYPKSLSEFEQLKIITPYMGIKAQMSIDIGIFYHNTKCFSFIKKDTVKEDYKFYLSILNSSIMWFFIKNTSTEFRGGYFTFSTKQVEPFPLPKLKNISDQQPFIQKADTMLSLNKELQNTKQAFYNELELEKLPKKLQNFEELEFDEFVKEYKKAKKLKFKDKLEERDFKNSWKSLFENDKSETNKLKNEIAKTDKEIDSMVYKLYNLTDEEIEIVQSSI